MLRTTVFAAVLAVAFTGTALANSCPRHMKAIDDALAKNPQLTAQQMTEVKKLRADGENLHKAGKHAESEAALMKAEGMLGIK
ncbi:hypothetical protein [Azospirillum sp.]|uniref:hypothetical protein n=1 Tax=Azospirillum sp. TaxID=34012 RepID=UPI002D37CB19|nr:hypothetical protein [Azospirillum sp.]HYD69380.1 hypothetical protein [Azospirillum sp.]